MHISSKHNTSQTVNVKAVLAYTKVKTSIFAYFTWLVKYLFIYLFIYQV